MVVIGQLDFVNGRYGWGGHLYSLLGKKWVDAVGANKPIAYGSGQMQITTTHGADPNVAIALMLGAALRHRYEWSVILNFPTCRIRFSTDPTGALQMFKDRNMEPFGNRRAPLLHWVAKHWRQRRSVEADMIEVRKHLRGRSDFEWRGFPVTIIPAEFDVEQAMKGAA